ncbi:MAG: phosphomannomutase/phosphoglucomutase [DPANN group archaeon]|nr:phosphomannomutase/phosphoglucomutase [DPANN group archaeon]
MDMSIFRAYDVRGVYGKSLTDEVMEKIGLALSMLMKSKDMGSEILVGADIRSSSPALLDAFVRGATRGGLDVVNCGITSFGVALFSGWKLKKDVTAFITASHNPSEWNGIKFYDKECIGFFEDVNRELGEIVAHGVFVQPDSVGKVLSVDMCDDYVKYLSDAFSIDKNVKVVVDCGNGSTSLSAPNVFAVVDNIDSTVIFDNVDPNFSDRGSDVEAENLQKLKSKVLETGAAFGVGFDGDGDRAGIVDDTGQILNSDQVTYALAKYMFSGNNDVLIINVECSMATEKQVEKMGGRVVRIPVGHTYMMQSAKEENAILGEETAFHFVIPQYFPFDDAILVPLKLAEILSKTDMKLSEIVSEFPLYPKRRVALDCPDDIKFDVVSNLKDNFIEQYGNEKVNTLDGVRVDFSDGWVLIRVSNTAPILRVTSEAISEQRMNEILENYSLIVKDVIETLRGV